MATIGLFLAPNQLQTLMAGQKLTSCESKLRIDGIDSSFIQKRKNSVGSVFDVADEDGKVKTKAKLTDAFITTYGNPDLRMLSGLGFGSDIQRYKNDYGVFWKENFPELSLNDETELFVSVWEHST